MATLTSVQKFLAVVAGIPTQISAALTGGAANAYQVPALNGQGQLDQTMMPTGVGPDTEVMVASEALAAGAIVNVWNNAGTQNARNADNGSVSKPAVGYSPAAVASGANATIYFSGIISGLSGLTPGATYFLGAAGAVVLAASLPTASGSLTQAVGVAISPTQLQFNPGLLIGN